MNTLKAIKGSSKVSQPFVHVTRYQTLKLTAKQVCIIELVCEENSVKEIASILEVSRETIKSHLNTIRLKLNVSNIAGLVRVAFQLGIIPLKYTAERKAS